MTAQEAIYFINNEVQIDIRFCTDEKVDKTIEVFKLAISALEKQIPKKPIIDLNNTPHYRCPNCKNPIAVHEFSYKYPHCKWCGQNLDWD